MNKTFLDTIYKYDMLSFGDTVLVGVSGGADSMALLSLLLQIRDKYHLNIIAAHIEHGIRGQESLNDADFVRSFCENNNVAFKLLSIDAVYEAKQAGLSVEEYARNRRYEFFDSIPCDKIATAHNLTDNVETVLFRLCRGTGLKGMCGIPPVRGKIIRPLIEIPSAQIRDYCKQNQIAYRTDSTNLSNDYARNSIRNEILPLLKQINDGCEESISGFISSCNEDYSLIDSLTEQAYSDAFEENKLSVRQLKNADIAVSKRMIVKYFESFGVSLDRLHLHAVLNLIHKSGRIQIKGNAFALRDGEFLRCAFLNQEKKDLKIVKEILNINEFNRETVDFYCDYDKINGKPIFRTRKSGDTISPAGRNCTKSLKKLFNELHIPVEDRENVVVVCDDSGVIGVVGYCVDERVRTDKNTKNILSIKLPLED